MKTKTLIRVILNLGLLSFGVGIVCAILTFTKNISLYFSFSFITLSVILIYSSQKMFRVYTIRRMDEYIEKHSRIECHKCHTFNEIDAIYCKNCGNKLEK